MPSTPHPMRIASARSGHASFGPSLDEQCISFSCKLQQISKLYRYVSMFAGYDTLPLFQCCLLDFK